MKGERNAAREGAGPPESPSQLGTHMHVAASPGPKVLPASRPPEATSWEAQPLDRAPRAPAGQRPPSPCMSAKMAQPAPGGVAAHTQQARPGVCVPRPGPGWASTAASSGDLGPHLVSSPAERQADARGRSAAGPGCCRPARTLLSGGPPAGSGGTVGSPPTVGPSAAPCRAARGSLGTRRLPASLHRWATRGASKSRHLVQPPLLALVPWGLGPLPPSRPGARAPPQGPPCGPGALTSAQQLGSQAAVLLGLPLRRNRLRKRSSRQSHSTRGPRPTGVALTSEPAQRGRRTGPLRPVRTPTTRAAGGEAGAANRPGRLQATEGPALALPDSGPVVWNPGVSKVGDAGVPEDP